LNAIPLGQFTRRYHAPTIEGMEAFTKEQRLLQRVRDDYCGGVSAELARRIGKDQTYVNRLFYPLGKAGRKGIGLEIMNACTKAFGLPAGYWEQPDALATEPQPEYAGKAAQARRVAIVGTAKMGDNGFYEEISSIPGAGDGYIEAASSDPAAYGLRVRGNSMAPAIRDGWYVLVEPHASLAEGEYVLVKLHGGQKMVKEFLYRREKSVELLSVNGQQRLTIYNEEIESIQAVAAIVPPSKWKPD
jgi:phage repressor protein C with HTH and peptisase S24 domain